MQIYRSPDEFAEALSGCALTIGNFDGVHRGHARIIHRLIEFARNASGKAVVFTFEPHPVRLLRPEMAPPPVTWTERKAQLLAELGVDALIAYPTDEALLAMTPDEFFQQIIVDLLDVRAMVEGPNFFFGKDRAGNVDTLREYCQRQAIDLEIMQPLNAGEQMISSSRIRESIRVGEVAQAATMLTQPYRIRGIVTHGAGRGAKFGFPTANLEGIDTLLPADGIYAGRAKLNGNASCFAAAIHIGPIPTFGDEARKTEVHILDYDGSLYGETIEVDFLARLREVVPFDSVDQLIEQIGADVARVRQIFDAARV